MKARINIMKTTTKWTLSMLPVFLLVSGCNKEHGPLNCDTAKGHFYRSAEQCKAADYYSPKVCESGAHIIPESAPLPKSPCYYTEAACNEEGYYSETSCRQLRKPESTSTSVEQDWQQWKALNPPSGAPGNR